MPVDEAAFIALHLHTANIQGGDMKQTLRQTAIIGSMVQTIKDSLNIEIDEDDLSYQRLITHLRFAISRISSPEPNTIDDEMLKMITNKFPAAYNCARKVANVLLKNHGMLLPEHELGYLTLHIERLRKR
jgi:beta-glucoside operon transcriptional antiterminator